MNIHPKELYETKYTEEEWSSIRKELARSGMDADTSMTDISAMFFREGRINLREGLEWASAFYAMTMLAAEITAELDKDIAKVLQQLKALEGRIDAVTHSAQWLPILDAGPYKQLKELSAQLREFEDIGKHRDRKKPPRRLSFLFMLLLLYLEAAPKNPAVGKSEGPLVCFLYEASRPVLGKHTFSKEAIRAWLKRKFGDLSKIAEIKPGLKAWEMMRSQYQE